MSGKKRTRPYRVTGGSDAPPPTHHAWLARRLGWLILCGVWVFCALSLVSFNAGDAPSHAAWPHNDPAMNWAGSVGAFFSYWVLRTIGLGIIGPMVFLLVGLVITATKRQLAQPVLRFVGSVLVGLTLAGFVQVLWTKGGAIPGLAGGTLGLMIGHTLLGGLSMIGTVLVLGVLMMIGLVIAADRLLWLVPLAIWRLITPAAAAAGYAASDAAVAAGDAAGRAARGGGGMLAGLGSVIAGRRVVKVALNDLGDEAEVVEAKPVRIAKKKVKKKVRRKIVPVEMEAEEEAHRSRSGLAVEIEDEDEDGVGAPQVFDRDALKAKIAKLPVRFAQANKTVATDEDLADLQDEASLEGYKFPTMDLLEEPEAGFNERLEGLVRDQAESLEGSLRQYRIRGEVVDIESGPAITLYHIRLAPGTKVSQINAISSDLARTIKAVNIRIVPNIEGRDTIGIEVPNPTKERVRLKELMGSTNRYEKMRLPMFLGKDASGTALISDLTRMPHMLIAGTTGSGKSVCMNTIIMSFLYTKKPNELKLVLVDPKMVEMSQFKDIPHLMCPVVTEMSKAAAILEWAVTKMDERYELLVEAGCRDITSYNGLEWDELLERLTPEGQELSEEQQARIPRQLPYMVFIIDELADLMMTHKEVEGSIIRIAQKARAVGIHLILATQRPQANVVTGLIKSNMPCRVAFKVASGMDSRIVLDQKGGELLLGQGDMLFLDPTSHELMRAQGTLVDDREIRRVAKFLKNIAAPSFERQLLQMRGPSDSDEQRLEDSLNNSSASLAAAQEDPLFDRAVEIVLDSKRGSVSLLQRRLAIGYTRASRLVDLMGIAGIISDHKGSVARDVLITGEEWEAMKALAEEQAGEYAEGAHEDDPDQAMLYEGEGEEPVPFEAEEEVEVEAEYEEYEEEEEPGDELDEDEEDDDEEVEYEDEIEEEADEEDEYEDDEEEDEEEVDEEDDEYEEDEEDGEEEEDEEEEEGEYEEEDEEDEEEWDEEDEDEDEEQAA